MSEMAPAVALLFDDTELGGQLREALHERGARIVHEGGVSSLSRDLLQQVGAEVVVVNLDDAADNALDRLYEAIEGDRPRVVFNDAQASRALTGWDRARWARHLAAKVLAVGDVDPPRPAGARDLELPSTMATATFSGEADVGGVVGEVVASSAAPAAAAAAAADAGASAPVAAAVPAEPEELLDLPMHEDVGGQREQQASSESEGLAAELEALLASAELPLDGDDGSGSGLRFAHGEDLPPLHDGNFAVAAAMPDPLPLERHAPWRADATGDEAPVGAEISVSEPGPSSPLSLADALAAVPAAGTGAAGTAAPAPVRAPEGWALLDDDALVAAPTRAASDHPDAAAFGIHKLSAADFLAPDVEQVAHDLEPTMSLQLISMEEAVAPQAYEHHDNEMLLDDLGSALSRIVLLGAAADGTTAVCDFLAALPAATSLTFLHTQHTAEQGAAVLQQLAGHCALPLRLAEQGGHVGPGEVLVVPAGQQVRLRRDGNIELAADNAEVQNPSIDASFTMAANVFGRDAVAIVFAGHATDAVAGAQAIHDRGGQVWVESSSGERYSDMVGSIFAERLVSFSGTPRELAAHLLEVFP
jgi:chemosensory pili system protein ChpB (putative protein-glutamate methylesterase)